MKLYSNNYTLKTFSTHKTIFKTLIFLILIYQLLLLKLNFKIYLRSEWRAPPRCGGRGSAGEPRRRPKPGARGPGVRAGGGPDEARGRRSGRAAAWEERAGGGAGGAGARGFNTPDLTAG